MLDQIVHHQLKDFAIIKLDFKEIRIKILTPRFIKFERERWKRMRKEKKEENLKKRRRRRKWGRRCKKGEMRIQRIFQHIRIHSKNWNKVGTITIVK